MGNINLNNLIIAHRGIHNNLNIPENSIKAFKCALFCNVPIELDIHLTTDNKLVVFHDSNLLRMTGENKLIRKCSYDELKKFNLLDTDEKIPLFEDVLSLVNGKVLIDIEIKNDKRLNTTIKQLIKVLDNYNGEVIIQSFYLKYLLSLKQKRKNYILGILVTNAEYFYYRFIDSKAILKLLKPNFIAYNKKMVKYSRIKNIRKKGISIFAWTIKNRKEKEAAFKYADSIISEYFN